MVDPVVVNRPCDVAVVGGGLVGTALAYELVCLGADVVLVDRHHDGRATDAGAGILSPETTWNPHDGWFAFATHAATHYRSLVDRLAADGAPDTGFAECGLLSVALRPGDDDWFASQTDLALGRSPGIVTEITPQEARALFPPLGDVRRAVHNPVAARVDGRQINAALLAAAERRGLRRLDAEVIGLRLRGDRAVGLDVTADGTADVTAVSCGAVAIAGGAWSPTFGQQLGVRIPVEPVKGQIVHLRLPDPGTSPGTGPPRGPGTGPGPRPGPGTGPGPGPGSGLDTGRWPIIQPVIGHYLVAWPEGRVVCGGTYESAGFDTRPTVAGVGDLLRECLVIAPGLADATVEHVRVGLRPVAADDLPVLGAVPGWANVHLDSGHGTEGLLLGPYSGALVADAVLGQPPAPELRPFSPARFVS